MAGEQEGATCVHVQDLVPVSGPGLHERDAARHARVVDQALKRPAAQFEGGPDDALHILRVRDVAGQERHRRQRRGNLLTCGPVASSGDHPLPLVGQVLDAGAPDPVRAARDDVHQVCPPVIGSAASYTMGVPSHPSSWRIQ